MFPSNHHPHHHQVLNYPKVMVTHDPQAFIYPNPSEPSINQVSNGASPFAAESVMLNSKKLQDELEKIGSQIKQHEDNLKSLKAQRNQLDDSILDLQVSLGKYISSSAPKVEDEDASRARSEEETLEQIMKHDKTAAGIFYQLKTRHGSLVSNMALMQDVLGVVAMLGKVDDDNLSRLFAEYLGMETMLAIVCKSNEGMQALEIYDDQGCANKVSGIHGLGASVGKPLEGRFLVIALEMDDPQKKLDLPKPKLPNGDIPSGFLGFAVNMITIDRSYLYCLTPSGYGLRETLFYNLFSRLQLYKTRAEMLLALPCISDGAISLDGGMIRTAGMFALGSREDVSVTFPKSSKRSDLPENYFEIEAQIRQKKWRKDRLQDDMKREQQLLDQTRYNFQVNKQEFVKFIADSSSYMAQLQMQMNTRDPRAPA
ncbi:DEFECTIVE IN MERISTEM SILENCING 3-like protein [Drosera capensis]